MKMRLKNTPFWCEVIGNAGTIENPLIHVVFKDGSEGFFKPNEVTEKTIKESAHDFMLSVFGEKPNRINQIKLFVFAVILAFIFGLLFA